MQSLMDGCNVVLPSQNLMKRTDLCLTRQAVAKSNLLILLSLSPLQIYCLHTQKREALSKGMVSNQLTALGFFSRNLQISWSSVSFFSLVSWLVG